MMDELCGEISVCVDCMIEHANGEISPDRPADLPAPWSALPFGYTVAMGGEHTDMCTPEARESDGCDCDDFGFSHRSCDGCGSHLAGDRYQFTMWRYTRDHGRKRHAECIAAARGARDNRRQAAIILFAAAQWRSYLGRLDREAREYATWMARRATA